MLRLLSAVLFLAEPVDGEGEHAAPRLAAGRIGDAPLAHLPQLLNNIDSGIGRAPLRDQGLGDAELGAIVQREADDVRRSWRLGVGRFALGPYFFGSVMVK